MVKALEETAIVRFYQIQNLQVHLATKEEELAQLMTTNNDYLMRIAKHQRTGIPYCNRWNAYQ